MHPSQMWAHHKTLLMDWLVSSEFKFESEVQQKFKFKFFTSVAKASRFISPPEIPLKLPVPPTLVSAHFVKLN